MDNYSADEGAAAGSPSGANSRDGAIDFTRYSDAQLEELKHTIDSRSSPLSYAHLIAEVERRRTQATEPPSAPAWSPGRFTPRDGLIGWLQAKRGRSPLYGSGSIERGPVDVWHSSRLKASCVGTARSLGPRKAQAHDEKDPRDCFDPIKPRVVPKCIVWTENGRSKQQASHEVVNGN